MAAKAATETITGTGWKLVSDAGALISEAVIQNTGVRTLALGFSGATATAPAHTGGITLRPGEGISKDQLAKMQAVGDTFAVWARNIGDGFQDGRLWIEHA